MFLRILLFPFRALWWLLKLVFTPWYVRMIFALPWWILGGIAILAASLAVQDGRRAVEGRIALAEALAQGPPTVVSVAEFEPARDASAYGEVRLLGTFRADVEVEVWEATGPDLAFLPLFVGDSDEVGAVLMSLKLKQGLLKNWIPQASADGRIIVPGAVRSNVHREGLVAALRVAGFSVADDVPIISPFLEGRGKGLERAVGASNAVVMLLAAIAALFGVFALYRFVKWRRRKRVKVPVAPPAPIAVKPPLFAVPKPSVNEGPWIVAPSRTKAAEPTPLPVAPPPAMPVKTPSPINVPRRPFVPRSPKAIVDEAFGRKPGGPKQP